MRNSWSGWRVSRRCTMNNELRRPLRPPLTNVNGTSAPLLDLASVDLIHQWESVQRLIPILNDLMSILLFWRRSPLSDNSPQALFVSHTGTRYANKLVLIYQTFLFLLSNCRDHYGQRHQCHWLKTKLTNKEVLFTITSHWYWELELKAVCNEDVLDFSHTLSSQEFLSDETH